jgi:hypothetical protein
MTLYRRDGAHVAVTVFNVLTFNKKLPKLATSVRVFLVYSGQYFRIRKSDSKYGLKVLIEE